MARILAISSYVASGHVGLGAIVPALHALGHDVIAIPTVVLSNHPGHPHVAGQRMPPESIATTIEALAANGWLHTVDRILTGYLPSPEHVLAAFSAVNSVELARSNAGLARPVVVCDPVLGDFPKGLYIDAAAATALRDTLLPCADLTTPNVFELGWLTGQTIHDRTGALTAASSLKPPACLITSLNEDSDNAALTNLLVQPGDTPVHDAHSPRRRGVPNGTGDLLAALATGALFSRSHREPDASRLGPIIETLDHIVGASTGRPELALIENLPRIQALQAQFPE